MRVSLISTLFAYLVLQAVVAAPPAAAAGNGNGPKVSIDDVTALEGSNGGTTPFKFTVSLSRAVMQINQTITVHWATQDGPSPAATAGSDYTADSGDVSFGLAETSKPVTIQVHRDNVAEANEHFSVVLSHAQGPQGALTISKNTGVGTILNDDGPALNFDPPTVSHLEGNSGTTDFVFTVKLAQSDPNNNIVVDWATADGTATAPDDYAAGSGQLTFQKGTSTLQQSITVKVVGDTINEQDETFTVALTNPQFAQLGANATATGTIQNDDANTALSINDVSVTEGNSGTTPATFTVTSPSSTTVATSVHWATADGTAVAPYDYAPASGDLTFNPGETSKTLTVLVNGDKFHEPNETFFVNLTNPQNVGVTKGQGVGTINDDDSALTGQITTGPGDPGGAQVRPFAADGNPIGCCGIVPPNLTNGGAFVARGELDGSTADGDETVIGAGPGDAPYVFVYRGDGTLLASFLAYDPAFHGGVRVAVGNVDTSSNLNEIITGAGPGGGPHVRVFSSGGTPLGPGFFAYDPAFTGGVFVAAGDVDPAAGDEIVTGAGAGGGPHVRVFSGPGGTPVGNGFFAYDLAFHGGVNVAVGNVDNSGSKEIVTGPGVGGGPDVRVFAATGSEIGKGFFAYDPAFRGGVFVASGNVDGQAGDEIVTGAGPGGGPHVRAFSGANGSPLGNGFYAYDPGFSGGVHVAVGVG
jgi:hypothetical protein